MICLDRRVVLHWKHTMVHEETGYILLEAQTRKLCLLHFWWMESCTYDMPRSACSVALEGYHGA
jgi:hypothetical protein